MIQQRSHLPYEPVRLFGPKDHDDCVLLDRSFFKFLLTASPLSPWSVSLVIVAFLCGAKYRDRIRVLSFWALTSKPDNAQNETLARSDATPPVASYAFKASAVGAYLLVLAQQGPRYPSPPSTIRVFRHFDSLPFHLGRS